jgi:hypothetical protein
MSSRRADQPGVSSSWHRTCQARQDVLGPDGPAIQQSFLDRPAHPTPKILHRDQHNRRATGRLVELYVRCRGGELKTVIAHVALPFAFSMVLALSSVGTSSAAGVWDGEVGTGGANVRSTPSAQAPLVGRLQPNSPLQIAAWVHGQRVSGVNETWGEIAPGEFVYSAQLLKPLPSAPPPPPQTFPGHWIDANLTEQVLTAYNGDQPVFWAVMSSGAPGTESPAGVHTILRRVPNETMSSATLSFQVEIPYFLTNVLYTQYFTDYGAAIHDNWWKGADSPFGVPTSHACLGLRESDALKFWNFAARGTVVDLHY